MKNTVVPANLVDFVRSIDNAEKGTLEARARPWDEHIDQKLKGVTAEEILQRYQSKKFSGFRYDLVNTNKDNVEYLKNHILNYQTFKQNSATEFLDFVGGINQVKHNAELFFLSDIGMFEDFLEFTSDSNMPPYGSMSRPFYYAKLIDCILNKLKKPKVNILEIGGGAGVMPFIFEKFGIVGSYTGVDLSEVLGYCAFNIHNTFAGADLNFNPKIIHEGKFKWNFVKPDLLTEIPENTFDLVINFHSFMEMNESTVISYFDNIYRTAKKGCLFFNSNRVTSALRQSDGSIFFSNPLQYPYRDSDHIISWEFDRVTLAYRQIIRGIALNHNGYIRACLIDPTEEQKKLGQFLVSDLEAIAVQ